MTVSNLQPPISHLHSLFSHLYAAPPQKIFRAPGRVNLIGEHTDYNDGFVLPMALDRAVYIAARARADRVVRMVALDFGGERAEFSLDSITRDSARGSKTPRSLRGWSDYVRGVAWALEERGARLSGADLLIQGDVPIGAGLSSSAALEVCAAMALLKFADSKVRATISRVEIARACQKAENEFVGVKSGIMDQFASVLARAGYALLIDCRDLAHDYVALPRGAAVVVCDTMKRRGLVESEYNARRAECEQAARLLGAHALRDVTIEELARREGALQLVYARRARHVVTENARVLDAVRAARANDLAVFGQLMNESHASLRDDFQVSCAELDAMVEIARQQAGCYGARLTGAGFGGCTVNLVADQHAAEFVERIAQDYRARVGIAPQVYVCEASAGAGVL